MLYVAQGLTYLADECGSVVGAASFADSCRLPADSFLPGARWWLRPPVSLPGHGSGGIVGPAPDGTVDFSPAFRFVMPVCQGTMGTASSELAGGASFLAA